MSKYLMLINIGPVQDFIASARRSRDLWFGSWFLSEISKTAAREIVEKFNLNSLIFPSALNPDVLKENSPFNAANKILAVVEGNPETVGRDVKTAIDKRFKKIYEDTFKAIDEDKFDRDLAVKQLEDLIEFYWTAVEFDGSDEKYVQARKTVEYLAASRKNTRNFSAVTWGANVPKSSLDGKRESVIYRSSRKMNAQELYKIFKIRDKEQLCGVGLLKRNGQVKDAKGQRLDRFASTSHIAAKPFLQNLNNDEAFRKFKESLLNLGIEESEFYSVPIEQEHLIFGLADGHLLYEERMRDYFDDREKISDGKKIVRDFLTNAFENKTPSPYYALLLADGDNMGKAIDAKKTPDEHRKLSQALSKFAESVKEIVNKKHQGSLFYAGGDDVLALVPLHTVLGCAKDLNKKFADCLKDFEYEDSQTKAMEKPTLSVGIAVAHHLEPLSDALELVRKAEKTAKSIAGKNALAIIVDKRSGVARIIKGQFAKDGDSTGIIEYLRQLIKFDKQGDVSRQAAYELRDLSWRLEIYGDKSKEENLFSPKDKQIRDKLVEIKRKEAKRILKRKLKNSGNENFNENDYSELFKVLEAKNGAEKLADELITAKIFADAEKMAGIEDDEMEEKGNE